VSHGGSDSLLCEPNVSEGRDPARIEAIAESVRTVSSIQLLHCSADPDHNRMVLAYRGPADAVVEATCRLAWKAFEILDLREHEGQHPRVGVLDVVPFVAATRAENQVALAACRAFGARVGDAGVPVFYYEDAATGEHRRALPTIRSGGSDGLEARMKQQAWAPDEGPPALHPSAGAVITGARRPLVRFNVNLANPDPEVARNIAKSIRESSGGLPAVRALGIALPRRGISQVTINLTDYSATPLADVYHAIATGATAANAEVIGTEMIGPVPRAALLGLPSEVLDSIDDEQVLA
jgi:glutamate formiminotransferase